MYLDAYIGAAERTLCHLLQLFLLLFVSLRQAPSAICGGSFACPTVERNGWMGVTIHTLIERYLHEMSTAMHAYFNEAVVARQHGADYVGAASGEAGSATGVHTSIDQRCGACSNTHPAAVRHGSAARRI